MSMETSNNVRRRGFTGVFVELKIVAEACSSKSVENCAGVLTESSPIRVELGMPPLIGVIGAMLDISMVFASDGLKVVANTVRR